MRKNNRAEPGLNFRPGPARSYLGPARPVDLLFILGPARAWLYEYTIRLDRPTTCCRIHRTRRVVFVMTRSANHTVAAIKDTCSWSVVKFDFTNSLSAWRPGRSQNDCSHGRGWPSGKSPNTTTSLIGTRKEMGTAGLSHVISQRWRPGV